MPAATSKTKLKIWHATLDANNRWAATGTPIEFEPASLRVSHESLSRGSSGRNDAGRMIIDWVHANASGVTTYDYYAVPVLEVTLPPHVCGDATYAKVLSYIQGRACMVTFHDPMDNDGWTLPFYSAQSSSDYYAGVIHGGMVQGETFKLTCMYNVGYSNQ